MKIFDKKASGALIAFVVTFTLMLVWFGYFILHANDFYHGLWGDGYKNYYTFAYYVAFDHGAHFSGMNYPFGDHVIFTDNQPILAYFVRLIGSLGHGAGLLHAIFTLCVFLSPPACASVIYLIFAEFNIKGFYAVISAIFISMLSPQLDSMGGHFGLSYGFIIPLAMWLLIRFSKTKKNIFLIVLMIFVVCCGLLHMYHLAILSAFILAYAIVYFLLSEKDRVAVFFSIKLLLASVIPFLIIKIFLVFTDPISDRPDNPWGFLDYCVDFYTVFLNRRSVIWTLLPSIIIPPSHGERWAYIGFIADVLIILFFILLLFRFALTRKILKNIDSSLPAILGASILLLLFAWGWPFKIHGCEYWLDYTGPLKQFRAPCRFAWVFYYAVNIFVIVYLAALLESLQIKKVGRIIVLTILFSIWFIDLNKINCVRAEDLHTYGRIFDTKEYTKSIAQALNARGFAPRNFQAILFFKYFTSGSEKSSITDGTDMFGMEASLYTGLKLIDAELSRTSLTQVDMNLQLMSEDFIRKDVIDLYKSQRPLLLIVADGVTLAEREKILIKRAHFIGKAYVYSDSISLYYFPLHAFNDSVSIVRQKYDDMRSHLINHNDYLDSGILSSVVYRSYDNCKAPYVLSGIGALYMAEHDTVLYEGILPHASDSSMYEFSIWNYGDHRVPSYPSYTLEIFKNKERIKNYEKSASGSFDVFGKWIRTGIQFILPDSTCVVKITGIGKIATYDELLIRPLPSEVLTHYDDKDLFMYNNYPIPK